MSRDENWVLSSEDSSCPDESELELGLGLRIGGSASNSKIREGSRAGFSRFLTDEDFSSPDVSSTSSLSVAAGTKRSADSVVLAGNGGGQVVGWPPVRAYRMISLSNQAKSQKNKNGMIDKTVDDGRRNNGNGNVKGRRSSFVKVTKDGSAIGRKVDLKAQGSYETLAETLDDMFFSSTTTITRKVGRSTLLDGSGGFALTYEDKDGDWMLVGDVPWSKEAQNHKDLRSQRARSIEIEKQACRYTFYATKMNRPCRRDCRDCRHFVK